MHMVVGVEEIRVRREYGGLLSGSDRGNRIKRVWRGWPYPSTAMVCCRSRRRGHGIEPGLRLKRGRRPEAHTGRLGNLYGRITDGLYIAVEKSSL